MAQSCKIIKKRPPTWDQVSIFCSNEKKKCIIYIMLHDIEKWAARKKVNYRIPEVLLPDCMPFFHCLLLASCGGDIISSRQVSVDGIRWSDFPGSRRNVTDDRTVCKMQNVTSQFRQLRPWKPRFRLQLRSRSTTGRK